MTGDLFKTAKARKAPRKAAKKTGGKKAPAKKALAKKAAPKASPKPPATAGSYSAKDIEVLEGLEPVRRRPGMYIGGTDERALHHLAAEILDNSMDEAVAGHAGRIEMHLAEDQTITITDNGRGIPVDAH
ncbi:MAG: ATP-binding protein, partial [Rhodospirillales bacterium]